VTGGTTGFDVPLNLLPLLADQLSITGSIMGALEDMKNMMSLIVRRNIEPEIGAVLPMERAQEAFQAMWEGKMHGKTVFTR
jgi:D-arabinose 1-dehydrogenase-like Zn-dependent alcohol dehydrogenase